MIVDVFKIFQEKKTKFIVKRFTQESTIVWHSFNFNILTVKQHVVFSYRKKKRGRKGYKKNLDSWCSICQKVISELLMSAPEVWLLEQR